MHYLNVCLCILLKHTHKYTHMDVYLVCNDIY